ncbi:MAG: hypothetical protein V1874_04130 [Spirochaetota bacterium]
MRLKYCLIAFLFVFCTFNTLHAAYPYVELYYWVYNGKDSGERADQALKKAGFTPVAGTFQQMDHVGTYKDYTGVVVCLNNENNASLSTATKEARFMFMQKPGENINLIIFIVSGPNYKEANRLALELKKSFEQN